MMTDSEICVQYRQAKDKFKQVGILADLNACGKDKIVQILIDNGFADPFDPATVQPKCSSTRRRWDDARCAELRELMVAGKSVSEIASHFGIAVCTLNTKMKKLGLKPIGVDGAVTIIQNAEVPKVESMSPEPRLLVLAKVIGDRMNNVMNAFAQGREPMGFIQLGELRRTVTDLQNEIYRIHGKEKLNA